MKKFLASQLNKDITVIQTYITFVTTVICVQNYSPSSGIFSYLGAALAGSSPNFHMPR